jgi:undecaprenyl diphosphate synthase
LSTNSHQLVHDFIGDRAQLPPDIVGLIEQAEEITGGNAGMTVVIALSYGGRHDIVAAARAVAVRVAGGELTADDIDDAIFAQGLSTGGIPDPDLLIRTSGEKRVSNFLLWQMAYSELYFTETLSPDFSAEHLHEAVAAYGRRQRRFGGLQDDAAAAQG